MAGLVRTFQPDNAPEPYMVMEESTSGIGLEAESVAGGYGVTQAMEITAPMIITRIMLNGSWCITDAPTAAGLGECLYYLGVNPGGAPTTTGNQAYVTQADDSNFGTTVTTDNPGSGTLAGSVVPVANRLAAMIVKSWIQTDGTGGAASGSVAHACNLLVNTGDYLYIHADVSSPVALDTELQATISYIPLA